MANSDELRLMISIIKIFQPTVEHADKKSWLIWLVPLFSIVLLWLSVKFKSQFFMRLMLGSIGIAIFGGATYKILTTDRNKLVLEVKIVYGLWLLLIGHLGLGLVNMSEAVRLLKKKS